MIPFKNLRAANVGYALGKAIFSWAIDEVKESMHSEWTVTSPGVWRGLSRKFLHIQIIRRTKTGRILYVFFFWINKPYLEDKGPPSDKAWDQVADSAREKSVVEHGAKM